MKQQNYNKTATIYKDSLTQDVKLAPLPKLNHAAKAYIDQATGGGGGSHHRSESKKEIEKEKTVNHPPRPPVSFLDNLLIGMGLSNLVSYNDKIPLEKEITEREIKEIKDKLKELDETREKIHENCFVYTRKIESTEMELKNALKKHGRGSLHCTVYISQLQHLISDLEFKQRDLERIALEENALRQRYLLVSQDPSVSANTSVSSKYTHQKQKLGITIEDKHKHFSEMKLNNQELKQLSRLGPKFNPIRPTQSASNQLISIIDRLEGELSAEECPDISPHPPPPSLPPPPPGDEGKPPPSPPGDEKILAN